MLNLKTSSILTRQTTYNWSNNIKSTKSYKKKSVHFKPKSNPSNNHYLTTLKTTPTPSTKPKSSSNNSTPNYTLKSKNSPKPTLNSKLTTINSWINSKTFKNNSNNKSTTNNKTKSTTKKRIINRPGPKLYCKINLLKINHKNSIYNKS